VGRGWAIALIAHPAQMLADLEVKEMFHENDLLLLLAPP